MEQWTYGHTEDITYIVNALGDVVLLNSVSHRNVDVSFEAVAQVQPMIIIAFCGNIDDPLNTMRFKLLYMFLCC